MEALIRLFKAVEIKEKGSKEASASIVGKTIKHGFVFAPEVIHNYTDNELLALISMINDKVGLSPEELNSSFHKSWQKIEEADIEQLVFEQIVHYFTTYGAEFLGIYNEDSVYIPNEQLDIPDIDIDSIRIVVIHGYTREEIKDKLLGLLESGIALHEDTVRDVVEVAKYVKFGQDGVDSIKNKEVRVALCDHLGIFPENPVEFLRYVIYKATSSTLLIKNEAAIEAIKESALWEVTILFEKYNKIYGLQRLAEIFYRFKPIFLAFKHESSMRPIINKIRKLVDKFHKPMGEDYLNTVTGKLKSGIKLGDDLQNALESANTFRKIRLAYALKYRLETNDTDSILYKIRNGKGYATEFSFKNKVPLNETLGIVLDSIAGDIKKNVAGKIIYIPSYIRYALPATEKQFTGDFPSGTYVTVSRDMIFGIHWKDVNGNRIDLDLSLISPELGKFGWDGMYRDSDRTILFSGDMTEAHNGATELFYVKRRQAQETIMFVNYYNYEEYIEVPYSIVVAQEVATNFKRNYMINPNNVKAIATSKINEKQKILGLLSVSPDECRFYFSETSIGRSITSYGNEYTDHARRYLVNFYKNPIEFNDILVNAGAIITDMREESDIDLSPESMKRDTIINLI